MNAELISQLESLHADAHGWALHCCGGDRALAEETLQNAYLKLLQGRARHEPGAATFKTWWFGVIRLTAREDARRQRFRESLPGRWLRFFGASPQTDDPRPGPSRRLELDERSRRLREALSMLPERQAETLHLVFYQDLTIAEAAGIMGISLGSARQHYERGKARLRAQLEPSLLMETR